jgi:ribosomal protein S12 methylthiotransferase
MNLLPTALLTSPCSPEVTLATIFSNAAAPSLPIIEKPGPRPAAAPGPSKGNYAFVSLGCPKNLVDSERMLGLLQLDGYKLVRDPEGTDFVIVNTCGFIERAREESFATIHEMLALKRAGKTRGVIVSGCLAERDKESLLTKCPDVDHLVGVFGREEVTKVADRLVGRLDEQRTVFRPAPSTPLSDRNRLRITPRHFAFLKISEGCDRLCTFCAIPKMRGKHATKPMEEVLAEARELADDGVRELTAAGIGTGLHYPTPVHLQPAYSSLGMGVGSFPSAENSARRLLSLPMFPEMTEAQVTYVADIIRSTVVMTQGGPWQGS